MILRLLGENKPKLSSLNVSCYSRTIVGELARILLTGFFFVCILFGPTPHAVSRNEVPGRGLQTSELSTINPMTRSETPGPMAVLYGAKENVNTNVPPPPMHKLFRQGDYFRAEQPQFFTVEYTGFTDEALTAFQYAVDIWNSLLQSPVPIWIDATFTDMGGVEDESIILGWARPTNWQLLKSLGVWFPAALADKGAGRDLTRGEPDLIVKFNSHEDVNWYFGTEGNTPRGKIDFVSTVLHEIAHGLGFFSAARVEDVSIDIFSSSVGRGRLKSGNPSLPDIYDSFVVTGSGTAITIFTDPSANLLAQFTGNNLFWDGKKGTEANGGGLPQLYAPNEWKPGSSYAHLDEIAFPAGNVNSLMTPILNRAEAIHNPGPVVLGIFEDIGWTVNKAPVFIEGTRTTRSVSENTEAGVDIGSPVVATDDNDISLTYWLSGTDAASFDIDLTSGQLKTKAALHYETKASYEVTLNASDGRLVDEIIVIIKIINVAVDAPANSVPRFIDGSNTTRSVAENTARGVNIGSPITAIDADDESLTYTLKGRDAASFHIDRTTGQLRTNATLDYETKRTYTVTVTVSDGSDTDTITGTINVTDVDDQKSPAITLTSRPPLMETTLNGSIVTLTLRNRVYENWIGNSVTVTGIAGVTVKPFNVDRVNDTKLSVQLTFDGTDLDTNATLTFTVEADAIVNYDGPALTTTARVTAATESVKASLAAPLTEATLNGSIVTLTLSSGVYEPRHTVGNYVTVSGIAGVRLDRFAVTRISDTQVTVKLIFDGTDFDTNATLTFRVGTDAIVEYNGAALVAQLPVIAVIEGTPIITAFVPRSLTEATLNESVVTLTLSSGVYARSIANIRRAVQVSGIAGVTFRQSDVMRVSDTQVTVKLAFDDTNFDTDTTLTFRVEAGAIAAYNGPALITGIPVTAVVEGRPTITLLIPPSFTEATLDGSVILLTLNNGTYVQSRSGIKNAVTVSGVVGVTVATFGVERVNDTKITVELEFDGNFDAGVTLTFTVKADAIAGYDGPALIARVVVAGGQESVAASTESPLTEATLDESVVTLTLNGATYQRSNFDIRDAVKVSGIEGVTFHWFDLDRISDTELAIELTFDGDIDADATLTFTVGADAIAGYDGPPLTAQVVVAGGNESILATTEAPLTEETLNGSVVTLTLSGRTFERSSFAIRDAVTVSGIDGVTIPWHQPDRKSDTQITIELEFNGDFDSDATLTFTVGPEALLRYNGAAFTVQVLVTGGEESVVATTAAPLTEATLDESVVTLMLKGAKYARSIFDLRDAVTVSGIAGVTIGTFGIDRVSDTEVTVELEYAGNIDTDRTLTFTVGADAIVGYNGPAFTVQVLVTGGEESVVATTAAPLTEATLDESVVILTLKGAKYARSPFDIRDAVTVSGIDGVTMPWHQPRRKSDTVLTVELEFDGTDFDTASILIFTVGAGAIAGYNGPALTARVPVIAIRENALLANFPNPFNPETWIPYQLAKPTDVTITIYAVDGQVVRTLALGHQPAGIYRSRSRSAYWDGRNAFGEPVASGIYFYTLTTGDFSATRKMLIRK